MVKVLPSMLACDFSQMKDEIIRMEKSGADALHLDVMDGQFVPNISYGLPVIKAMRQHSSIPLDVHLMTLNPEQFIDALKQMGVEMISFHVEATHHPHRLIQNIKSLNIQAGIALNPHTPISAIEYLLPEVDYVLIMTVNPGFGGQNFIDHMVQKIETLNSLKDQYAFEIEVDGGINIDTGKMCKQAGATMLVSGSYVFNASDPKAIMEEMRNEDAL